MLRIPLTSLTLLAVRKRAGLRTAFCTRKKLCACGGIVPRHRTKKAKNGRVSSLTHLEPQLNKCFPSQSTVHCRLLQYVCFTSVRFGPATGPPSMPFQTKSGAIHYSAEVRHRDRNVIISKHKVVYLEVMTAVASQPTAVVG